MKDDKDMIRQMRLLYAKGNTLLRIFNKCTTVVKLVLLDSYCIYRFIQRLQDSDNLLIQSVCKSWVMKFSIWNHWIEALCIF